MCRETNLFNNQSSETVSDKNDFGRQRLLISLDQQGPVHAKFKSGRTNCRPRSMSSKFSRVLAWSLMLAVDIVCGLVMFALYPYTNTREYGISSARKSLGQNFPLSWVQVLNGWSFRPRAFRPWTKTKLLNGRQVNRRDGSAGGGGLSRTRSYEPLEEYTPPLEMGTRALSNPASIVRFMVRILSCRSTYHTRQTNQETQNVPTG